MKTTSFICFIFSFLFLNNKLLSQTIAAKYNLHVVDSLVYTINPNAKLRLLFSDSLLIDGTSFTWNYLYDDHINSSHTTYYLHSTCDSVFYDSLNQILIPGIMYIDSLWIDSDSAIILAEEKGGKDFRENHTSSKITACLEKPYFWDRINRNRWHIVYKSLDNPTDNLHLFINASSDSIVGIKNLEKLPNDLILNQNYPNPFNPITTIKYSIPTFRFVTLKIYDSLGREIETLVNEEKSAGNYELKFNGCNHPSGVYFYQLKAGSFSETKKFILMK